MEMTDNRLALHDKLVEILGSNNVYYIAPGNKYMKYPAIVYSRQSIRNTYAENSVYKHNYCYKITVIDENPDSEVVTKISNLPLCEFDTHYLSDGLNHDVFTLYYEGGNI